MLDRKAEVNLVEPGAKYLVIAQLKALKDTQQGKIAVK